LRYNSGAENLVVDHLSRIEGPIDFLLIRDNFPDEHLIQLHSSHVTPWFADIVNFIVASIVPPHASRSQIDKLNSDAKYYVWDDPYLWRFGSDQVIRMCVPDHEIQSIVQFCHGTPTGGHFGPQRTATMIMGSIGPPFLEMLIIFPSLVSSVREREGPLHKGMRCPNSPLFFC